MSFIQKFIVNILFYIYVNKYIIFRVFRNGVIINGKYY